MRSVYLVSYDISDQKRWRKVYRILRDHGDPLHYSVFRCDLSPMENVSLTSALTDVINHSEDRIMIVNLGPSEGRCNDWIVFFGRANETLGPFDGDAVII